MTKERLPSSGSSVLRIKNITTTRTDTTTQPDSSPFQRRANSLNNMQTDISSMIGPWKHYELSADGREMMLVGETKQVRFIGIVCINLCPASRQEQTDEDKEIDEVISYRLTDHRVPHAPSIAYPHGTSVEIGPPHLRVYLHADWNTVRHLRGFHVHADYFSVTLICHGCEVNTIEGRVFN